MNMSKYKPELFITSGGHIRPFVLLYMGSDGINVVGPFHNPDFVSDWAKRMGLTENQYTLSYLFHPMD